MSSSPPVSRPHQPDPSLKARLPDLQAELQKLERRDWWLWSMAIVVMPLLTFAVFAMSFPGALQSGRPVL